MLRVFNSATYIPLTKAVVEYETSALNPSEGVVFVVPEVVKASAERIMFGALEKSDSKSDIKTDFGPVMLGSLNREVLSFNRLATRLLSMVGMESTTDSAMLRNVIYRVLMESPADFPVLKKLASRFEYVDMLVDLLGDFRRYSKKADDLRALCPEEKGKLYEISLLLERIDKMALANGLTVNEDVIAKATELLLSICSPDFKITPRYREICDFVKMKFVISGFGNTRLLTPQEIGFIKALSNCGAMVIFYVASSSDNGGKFFANGDDTVKSLTSIGGIVNAFPFSLIRKKNALNDIASKYAYEVHGYVSSNPDDSVKIISYHDYDDMISFMANEINRLVGQEDYRYSDIRIMCSDQSIIDRIKCIFGVFNLQMFIDRKIILLDTPVVRYALLLLRLSSRNYDIKSVLRLLRTGVLIGGARRDLIDAFDNYCAQENISDKNRLFNRDYYGNKYLASEEESDEDLSYDKPLYRVYDNGRIYDDGAKYIYENVVEKILLPIKSVCDEIDEAKTISKKASVLAIHLGSLKEEVEMLRDEFLDRGDYDTSLAIVKGYSELMDLLSQLSTPLNDVAISRDAFLSMIMTDMKNKASGAIPLCADSVEICSISNSAYTPCKVLFVIGANSENFPHSASRSGILSSEELKGTGLPDKAINKNRQEFVECCLLLNGVEDKIYMLHFQKDFPSSVLKYFNMALTGDKDTYLTQGRFRTPVYGSPVTSRFEASKITFSPENVKKMFDGRSVMSVSSLEGYFTCPLQFFLNKGLKIDSRNDNSSVDSREIGLLCHSMMEFAMKDVKDRLNEVSIDELINECPNYLKKNTLNYFIKAVSQDQISKPDKYMRDYRVNPGLKVMRIFESYYPVALQRIKEDGFKPDDFELKLEELPVKIVPSDNPLGFEFKGSIDRVDVNDGLYRIIDYKTGGKEIEYNHVYDGIQIQPFLYAHGLRLQGKSIENVGYINLFKPTTKTEPGKATPLFEYDSHCNDYVSMEQLMDFSVIKLDEVCRNIADGIGFAVPAPSVGEDKGGCAYCSFKGSCGRRHNDPLFGVKLGNSKEAPIAIANYVKEKGDK